MGADHSQSFLGERREVAQALPDGAQPVVDVVRLGERGRRLGQGSLELNHAAPRLGERLLDGRAAREQRGLVRLLLLEVRRYLRQVVGEQARACVARRRLDRLRLARDLRLLAERAELAPNLAREVLDAREVPLHRVELPERLLLALAVLEDARRLLDEVAAILRGSAEDVVEVALRHDDVHLAAEPRVAQQLLDIQEPTRLAVDAVLGSARPKQGPRDRHLGVLDGEHTVVVVDRERDLGASERRAAGRAREDDVLHAAAAKRLGALLAHHPRQRVDDIGLAGAVRPDDARDARLELQRRRGREGLEAPERQRLEVHGGKPRRSRDGRERPWRPRDAETRWRSRARRRLRSPNRGRGCASRGRPTAARGRREWSLAPQRWDRSPRRGIESPR